jgi:biotin operon repressor
MADNTGGGSGPNGENVRNAEEIKDTFAALDDILRSSSNKLTESLKRAVDSMRELDDAGRKTAKESINTINSEIKRAVTGLGKSKDIALNLNKEFTSSKKLQESINKTKSRQSAIEGAILSLAKQGVELSKKQQEHYDAVLMTLEKQAAIEGILAEYAKKRESAAGNLGKLFKDLNKIPLVGALIKAEQVTEAINKAAEETGSRWASFGAGIKATFISIGESLTDPVVVLGGLIKGFTSLVKLAAEYQSKQFEAAKDLGVSVERGKQLRDGFVDLARANLQLAVTADDLQKSYAGVQNELGIIVKQSEEFNLTSTLIERRTSATAASMAQLQFAAKGANTSLMQTYQSIVGAAKAAGARLGVVQSEKQILEGIAQTSGTIYQNFQGNFKAIAAANTQAKALGTTLDKINATQDQFLDFESSIAKQFEAEVLTGKDLNLTTARQLALNHDTQGLMVEINKLIGSSAEWNKLDTITQQSKAEALGMSRDAVNQMYMDQQRTTLLGKDAAADLQTQYDTLVKMGVGRKEIEETLGREAVMSARQVSASEQLKATMDGIKNTIGEMSQALMPFIKGFTELIGNVDNLKKIFVGIVGVLGTMATLSIALKINAAQQATAQIARLTAIAETNAMLVRSVALETEITELDVAQAMSKVTGGSAYLGPGAIAVGLAAGAVLAGVAGLALSGIGGGAGNTPPVTNPTTGIAPMNTAVAGASANNTTATSTTAGNNQPQSITVYTVVDGEVLAKKVVQNTPSVYGRN